MKDLADNNVVRFKKISKKADALYANLSVKGVRRGVQFSASITVDLAAVEMDAGESLEKIVEECARIGVKEFKSADFQFEGITKV